MSAPAWRPQCAACRRIGARCSPQCAYAPHFPAGSWGAMRFAVTSGTYGGHRNLAALINACPPDQGREDAVNMLVYVAARHRKDPARGGGGGGRASVLRLALARQLAGFTREPDAVTTTAVPGSGSAVTAAFVPPGSGAAHAAAASSSSAVMAASLPPESVNAAPPLVQQQQQQTSREQAAAATVGATVAADQGGDPSQAVGSACESGASEDIAGSEHAQEESSAPAAPPNLKRKRED